MISGLSKLRRALTRLVTALLTALLTALWRGVRNGAFDAVECTGDGACWASGSEGRVGLLVGLKKA